MDNRIVTLLQETEQLKKELDKLRPLDKEREAIVLQKLRLDWNFHSNHLEGNSLTFGETKALILFGITAQGKPLKDHFEITGHDEAIKWVEDIVHKKEPLTESFIRQLHTLLLKKDHTTDAITPDGQPTKKTIKVGEYKSTPNHVETETGEIFRFATPEETPAKMNDLMAWLRDKEKEKETNPVLLAADFHYKFIRIHPFDDGNGRVARILMNFILMQNGYPPTIIKTQEKKQYIAALEQADAGIFEPFFEFIITNEARSLELMLKGARGENIEEPDDLDKEIALLKQKIKSKNNVVTVFKNESTIKNIVRKDIYNFSKYYFIEMENTFGELYQETKNIIRFNNISDGGFLIIKPELIISLVDRSSIDSQTNSIRLLIQFFNIKFPNEKELETFNYDSYVDFRFNESRYIIQSADHKKTIAKFYNENLNEEEIHTIVKYEKLRHKNALQSFI